MFGYCYMWLYRVMHGWLYVVMGDVYVIRDIDNTDLCGFKEQYANMAYNYEVQT